MIKKVKKVLEFFSTVLVVLIVVATVLMVGVRLFGLQVFSVLSGSMEPEYKTGSLIYVKEVDPYELATGDVITFMVSEDTVVSHRIAGVVPDDEEPSVLRFRTKGDANKSEDATMVHMNNIIGTPVFQIPYLGYVSNFVQEPPGTYYAIAMGALLLMLMFIPDLLDDDKKDEKKAKKPGKYEVSAPPAEPEKKPVPAKEKQQAPVKEKQPVPARERQTVPARERQPAPAPAEPKKQPTPAPAKSVQQEEFDFDRFLEELKKELN